MGERMGVNSTKDGSDARAGSAGASGAHALEGLRARHAGWASVAKAEGEYKDFSKFDYAAASRSVGAFALHLPDGPLPPGVTLSTIGQIEASELASRLSQSPLPISSDRPSAWHAAHVQDGFYLHVPAGVKCPPLHLRSEAAASSALHHVLVLEQGAQAEVIIEAGASGAPTPAAPAASPPAHLHTDVSEAFMAEDSQLTLTTLQRYPLSDWSFSNHHQHQSAFAKLWHTAVLLGSATSRVRAHNLLKGGHARADSYQMFCLSGHQFVDLESLSHHQVPDTQGQMDCRGVLTGSSEGVYRGSIKVDRAAPNTVTHQAGSVLLLSKSAKADIIPTLTVDNNQVEAGHGAKIGSLDGQELLYLRTRGLDEAAARRLMLGGYFDTLLKPNPSSAARAYLGPLLAQATDALHIEDALREKRAAPASIPANPGEEARPSTHTG